MRNGNKVAGTGGSDTSLSRYVFLHSSNPETHSNVSHTQKRKQTNKQKTTIKPTKMGKNPKQDTNTTKEL